jgi:hypothetical protein
MNALTFRDFYWRSKHHIPAKHGIAALPHWHSYKARFWFTGSPDQDCLIDQIENTFRRLHGAALNSIVQPDSTDESVAAWLYSEANTKIGKCVKVAVENDGQRGAEVSAVKLDSEADPYFGVGGAAAWRK